MLHPTLALWFVEIRLRSDHSVEQAVAPNIMMPKRRQTVNGGHYHKGIRRELMPFINAMPNRPVTAAELRHRPDSEHVETAI
jgi:hypothetical protein